MELWIRSQDKNVLENVKGFCITHSDETHWNILNVNTTTRYGTYKTKERTLEVLDEIQNILQPKPLVIVRPSEEMVELLGDRQVGKTMKMKQDFEFKKLSTYVYQMPEE